MAKTIQSELLEKGMVVGPPKEELYNHVKYQLKHGGYPKNRLGKVVMWAKWDIRKKIPKNAERRCCLCGIIVKPSRLCELVYNEEIEQSILEKISNIKMEFRLMVCKDCNKP